MWQLIKAPSVLLVLIHVGEYEGEEISTTMALGVGCISSLGLQKQSSTPWVA